MSLIRRAAVLIAAVGAVTVALAAPAAAEPVNDAWQNCTEPMDGAVLCVTATPDPVSGVAQVTGSLTIEPGRTFYYGMLTLYSCQWIETERVCEWTPLLIGRDVDRVVTQPFPLDDDHDYWVSANWRDDQWHTHIGVHLDGPEVPPEG
jgi:hypothetical protein